MGVRLSERAAIEPFAIDQTPTVKFTERDPYALQWVEAYVTEIEALGGAAGFLSTDAPEGWSSPEIADAFVLALDNDLD
jgi:hypothetical protein